MRWEYVPWKASGQSAAIVDAANTYLDEYSEMGYQLSLRQLYYRFVADNVISNSEKSYKRLGDIITRARDAGLIDWDMLVDRNRSATIRPDWGNASSFLSQMSDAFTVNLWRNQRVRCEVWVEKAALEEIAERAASAYGVTSFACRGYVSSSTMREAAMRLVEMAGDSAEAISILHLGDHDPSGLDMTRDIEDRLKKYFHAHVWGECSLDVHRIALNMDQIDEYGPPPNPAKVTDSRFADYQLKHGDESWELDSLPPDVLAELIREKIELCIDNANLFEEMRDFEQREKDRIMKAAKEFAAADGKKKRNR